MSAIWEVGRELDSFERVITLTDMVAYAGATWDWHQMHYDTSYTNEAGLAGPVVDGQVFGALFVELLQNSFGPSSFVHTLDFTFRNLMFAGEALRIAGTITSVVDGVLGVDLSATILASDFGPERAATARSSASVLLGAVDASGAGSSNEAST